VRSDAGGDRVGVRCCCPSWVEGGWVGWSVGRLAGWSVAPHVFSHSRRHATDRYVHLPFCKKKCLYCDFPVVAVGSKRSYEGDTMMEAYVDAVVREIEMTPPFDPDSRNAEGREGIERTDREDDGPRIDTPLRTIYFGGGTPSLIPLKSLERLLGVLRRRYGAARTQEITIEADPGTFDLATINAYRDLGITRMSVGVQAFDEGLLARCGRSHGLYDVYKAIDDMHASSMPSWSLDLISGLPDLDLGLWERNVLSAIDAGPKHISSYDLQVEENTPFGRLYRPGAAPLPSDEDAARMYGMASGMLRGAGYGHYELSSYALREPGKDHRCVHNGVYWDGGGYYAFGMGAASYVGGVRVVRPRTLRGYTDWVGRFAALVEEQGEDIRARQVVLPHVDGVRSTGEDMLTDAVMLQLRKGGGLRLRERIVDRFERGDVIASVIRQAVAEHIQRGLVEVIEEVEQVDASGRKQVTEVVVRLTDPDGFLMSNDVISDIFLALDELKFD